MISKKIYKIRRKSDGKYSNGGLAPFFSDYGKTWGSERHVRIHLEMFRCEIDAMDLYDDCEIIEYDLVPNLLPAVDINEIFTGYREEATVAALKGDRYY